MNNEHVTECTIRWVDDGTEENVRIYEFDYKLEWEGTEFEDSIFFYGMSWEDCYNAMVSKEVCVGEWQIVAIMAT